MKFRNDSFIEKKIYPLDFAINGSNKKLVIVIIYDKSIFLANNS